MKPLEKSTPLFKASEIDFTEARPLHDAPLAYVLAPQSFDHYIGQTHILGTDKPLRLMIESDQLASLILWGPPGCGKTALSRLIASKTKAQYIAINAVTAKVADIKSAIDQAKSAKKTILFIDEIHRFNKLQQDALLPEVENGTIVMIGATTQNPFFSVIPALISRAQVYELFPLQSSDLKQILHNTLVVIQEKHPAILVDAEANEFLINHSQGDARKLINMLEMAICAAPKDGLLTRALFEALTQSKGVSYDEDTHYDVISAFIKSLRGSDPDAAIYWLTRMLNGGEDPSFIARRMVIFASEDIGNADPQALPLATALIQAVHFIGMPEIQLNLTHVAAYLATAPKSNAACVAMGRANRLLENGQIDMVPMHLRDASYKGAKRMGFGQGYLYPHDYEYGLVKQVYWDHAQPLYEPKAIGFEKTIQQRMAFIKNHFAS